MRIAYAWLENEANERLADMPIEKLKIPGGCNLCKRHNTKIPV
jgi:hypothetical protein